MGNNPIIYFDHASTTFIKPQVLEAMTPYLTNYFGNASSVYSIGRESKKAIEESRAKVAEIFNADSKEIYFTSSGTESDNWALRGVLKSNLNKGKHIITCKIEHSAILETCKHLELEGFEVTYLDVDEFGFISLDELKNSIREDTVLVSIMFANNEIGTIQPIKEISKIVHEKGSLFHTDAVQVAGTFKIDVKELGIDLMSVSAHKFYGPKGVGVLYVKRGIKFDKLIYGGHQERGKRASTENVASIVGLSKALEIANSNLEESYKKIYNLREKLIDGITDKISNVKLNGSREKRLPGNINFSFENVDGETLLLLLDMNGICASSGSACTSGSLDASHVLLAIGLSENLAKSSLRISLGDTNSEDEIDKFLEILPKIINKLRIK